MIPHIPLETGRKLNVHKSYVHSILWCSMSTKIAVWKHKAMVLGEIFDKKNFTYPTTHSLPK